MESNIVDYPQIQGLKPNMNKNCITVNDQAMWPTWRMEVKGPNMKKRSRSGIMIGSMNWNKYKRCDILKSFCSIIKMGGMIMVTEMTVITTTTVYEVSTRRIQDMDVGLR